MKTELNRHHNYGKEHTDNFSLIELETKPIAYDSSIMSNESLITNQEIIQGQMNKPPPPSNLLRR